MNSKGVITGTKVCVVQECPNQAVLTWETEPAFEFLSAAVVNFGPREPFVFLFVTIELLTWMLY